MPDLSGWDLVELVRRERPAIRVLYISGYPGEQVARAGVTDDAIVVAKPLTAETLAARVREVLDGG
jgi:CheY-like chemotaxis protein